MIRDEAVNGTYICRCTRFQATRLNPIKNLRPPPISYISLSSHSFFSDIVEETYNKNPSLCIYLKKLSFNSMCCLQHCEEHYLDRGVTDKKTALEGIRKRGGLRILAAFCKGEFFA